MLRSIKNVTTHHSVSPSLSPSVLSIRAWPRLAAWLLSAQVRYRYVREPRPPPSVGSCLSDITGDWDTWGHWLTSSRCLSYCSSPQLSSGLRAIINSTISPHSSVCLSTSLTESESNIVKGLTGYWIVLDSTWRTWKLLTMNNTTTACTSTGAGLVTSLTQTCRDSQLEPDLYYWQGRSQRRKP